MVETSIMMIKPKIIHLPKIKIHIISACVRTCWGTGGECYAAEDGVVHHPHRKYASKSLPPELVCLHFAGSRASMV